MVARTSMASVASSASVHFQEYSIFMFVGSLFLQVVAASVSLASSRRAAVAAAILGASGSFFTLFTSSAYHCDRDTRPLLHSQLFPEFCDKSFFFLQGQQY